MIYAVLRDFNFVLFFALFPPNSNSQTFRVNNFFFFSGLVMDAATFYLVGYSQKLMLHWNFMHVGLFLDVCSVLLTSVQFIIVLFVLVFCFVLFCSVLFCSGLFCSALIGPLTLKFNELFYSDLFHIFTFWKYFILLAKLIFLFFLYIPKCNFEGAYTWAVAT